MASAFQAGDVLGDRYLCKGSRIFLDSKPGLPPLSYAEVAEELLPYLRLSPYQLHVPQIYEWLQFEGNPPPYTLDNTLLLLDQAPIYRPDSFAEQGLSAELPPSDQDVLLLPSLPQMWRSATPFRQLHWLWQMAQLWHPLTQEGCASTLFNSELLRVEGGLLRLLELHSDKGITPTLPQLGQLWLDWATTARSEIQAFLQHLSQQLVAGTIHNAEQLVDQLDGAIAQVAQAQMSRVQIVTRTDRGPTRQRNEDACYPPGGREQSNVPLPLVIVCDGIGGHQGGDVASNLAIEAVAQRILSLQPETLDSTSLMVELEKAACLANDVISQRNDSEQRFDRQRMGTTIVIALIRNHELYIAHVGDSRAYWITRWGCHQITVDDDIASREVRLGYSTYRQALQQPSSGALVQALGMVGSSMLYPTVQRFLLDEDSVFLLCSDGLCDNDRVEEVWDTEILSVLGEKGDLLAVSRKLIEVGNTRNGYDNVTVGLLSCRIARKQPVPVLPAQIVSPRTASHEGDRLSANEDGSALNPSAPTAPLSASLSSEPTQLAAPVQLFPSPQTSSPQTIPDAAPTAKTRIIPRKSARPRLLPWFFCTAALAGLAVGGYPLLQPFLQPLLQQRRDSDSSVNREPVPAPSAIVPPTGSSPEAPAALTVNTLLRIRPASPSPTPIGASSVPPSPEILAANPLILQARPAQQTSPSSIPAPTASAAVPSPSSSPGIGVIPFGTILEVLNKQGTPTQEQWVKLRVCSVPITAPPANSSATTATSPLPSSSASGRPAAPTPASNRSSAVPTVQLGQEGWLREADLLPIVSLDVPTDRASCPPLQNP